MARKRKSHSAAFKARVALAAVKCDKTVSELASLHGVHPTMIHTRKKQLVSNAEELFQAGVKTASVEHEALQAQLYEQIGRLKTELDWLKKKLPASVERKRACVDPADRTLSVSQQCDLLGLSRSSVEHGYHVYSDAERVHVPDGGDGLALYNGLADENVGISDDARMQVHQDLHAGGRFGIH